jgi:hypothetical protein
MRPHDDFDVLLEAPAPIAAQIARQILDEAGIPSMLHGRDIGVGGLGGPLHQEITRPDLLVPRGAKGRAEEALERAGFE